MKVHQYDTVTRIVGTIFLLLGLLVLTLTPRKAFLAPEGMDTTGFLFGILLGVVFSFAGWACIHGDYVVISRNNIKKYSANLFSHSVDIIPREQIIEICLEGDENELYIMKSKSLVIKCSNGEKTLIKEVSPEKGQIILLQKISEILNLS